MDIFQNEGVPPKSIDFPPKKWLFSILSGGSLSNPQTALPRLRYPRGLTELLTPSIDKAEVPFCWTWSKAKNMFGVSL